MSSDEGDDGDLTRKQRREQARAQRKAMEEAAAASAARRTRLTQLGVAVAVVVVAIVIVLIATSGGSKSGLQKGNEKNTTVTQISSLIGGIPQSGNALGSPAAPVTLKYFGDLECPICREFTLGALPQIIEKYVRPGKVRIEYHSMETATHEPEVFNTQQVAAYAAGRQNKAWYFIETFYHEQGEEDSGYVTESYLQGIAKQVPGLNLAKWASDRNDSELANEVATDKQIANNEGFNGTPSFLIGKSGGGTEKITELSDEDLKEASALFGPKIEKLLAS
ncbi:MAG TPA: thioredoxin domain-containing protein [Solirubrobacteraceae bacterium]|nr:thioredoxin domain-containing protein [Solirubrobacteraceae bacterium]